LRRLEKKGTDNHKMASIKITVPSGGKASKAFNDALKVSIAASAYNMSVQWVKGTLCSTKSNSRGKGHPGEQKGKTHFDGCKRYRSVCSEKDGLI
jgi:hypothetical protein